LTITLGATDAESCELTFSIVQGPGSGALGDLQNQSCAAGSPDSDTARIVYGPGSTAGTFTFTYRVNDGSADSNIATVAIVNGTAGQTPRVVSVTRNSSTQLTATVEIRAGGPKKNRSWDVQVTNPDGTTAVGAHLLTITP